MSRIVIFKQELRAKGGLEKAAFRIANAFVQKGCEVTLVTATPSQACSIIPGVHIASFPLSDVLRHKRLTSWDTICQNYLSNSPATISLSFDRTTPQTHIRAGNGIHAAYLDHRRKQTSMLKQTSFRFNPFHRTLLQLEKHAFHSPNLRRIIVNSDMVKQEAIRYYDVDPQRFVVLHNGVEWTEFTTHFADWPVLRSHAAYEIGSDPSAFHFLFAGHEYRRKGLDLLLDGLACLKNASSREFRLVVIGRDKHIESYKKKARRLGLKHIYFLGPRTDAHRFYALADACVIPSLYDPFANVTVEALAMGVYVVSSAYNGGAEVLQEHTGTIIKDLHDPHSIAESLQLALERPKTFDSSETIRYSVRFLDYPFQLDRFINACLS